MDFKKAYEALKQGHKIKREHWRGYWVKENNTITMHCKDGSVIPFLETDDIFVDLDNIVADNWIICDEVDEATLNINTFTFGEAISNLKRGKRVARKGWNGKNQYIELATNISYKNSNDEIVNAQHEAIGNKAIAFVGTSGVQLGWLASQADMLAEDWGIKEEKSQHMYIPNTIEIEAFELKKGEKFPIRFETNKQIIKLGFYPETGIIIEIDTCFGKQTIYEGDYVIKDGEYIYALPALVFKEKYKKAEG